MTRWQQERDTTEMGRWTHELIGNMERWTSRGHGDIDNFLMQALTSRNCFNEYFYMFKRAESPKCSLCEADIDDANYTLFVCDTFGNWQWKLSQEMGHSLTKDNLVDQMLQGKVEWQLIAKYIYRIMRYKYEEERRRHAEIIINIII
jgi:hypothetical protein